MSGEPFPEDEGMPDEEWIPPQDAAPAPAPAGVDTNTGELTEDAPGLEVLPDLLDRMDSVEELAANLFEELTSYPAGGPWFWEELNSEQRKELWAELDGFVVWLQNRILRHWSNSAGWVPACWYRHPDAVEMLTALMVAHKAAYRAKSKKPSFELTEWFSRALWPTMETFEKRLTFKNCMENQGHYDATGAGLELTAASDDFTAFVEEETAVSESEQTEPADA
ncbi:MULTISPECIES: hypothetical protein [unclassified Paenarthrobacter]|uniref:hypothetical protein n=1 Tax=unclassified Paenarthrobacter TaxID=2634190 RepID=UPI00141EE087|nr:MULTISPECIES: hypothetical protein [unclassified Paenarthrobacter]NHW49242.1 hypothetical protein [Paenarthrobacter sp. MSM-2-10-13]WIV33515.1 hypothetical protein QN084_22890 [Paenarthrobacter sp. R1]